MKSTRNSLAGILGLSLLALSFSFATSAARADDFEASPPQNIASDPVASMIQGFEERIAGLEATVMALKGTTEHVTSQICVADGTGAETCVSKAQLDALLKLQMKLGEAPAAPDQPQVAAVEAPVVETPAAETQVVETQVVETLAVVETAPAIESVAAIVAEVTVTTTIAVVGEDAQKSDELITGSVAQAPTTETPAERIE